MIHSILCVFFVVILGFNKMFSLILNSSKIITKNFHQIMPKKKKHFKQNAKLKRIVFLGTASMQPSPLKRNVSSMCIQTSTGSLYMIDCGEGTQHQIKLSTLKIGKLHSIFITHLHGDHSYGLFGLLHSIRHESMEFTLNIYGPKGLKTFLSHTLRESGGLNHYRLNIIELELPNENNMENNMENNIENKDNNDNNNDNDSVISIDNDTDVDTDMENGTNNNTSNNGDKVSHVHHCSGNDDIFTTEDVINLGEIEKGITGYACRISHRIATFGYVFVECDDVGKLDGQKATKLGAKGRQLGLLKNGKDVTLDNGTIIYSKDVVSEPVKGKKIAIMQDCYDCRSCYEIAKDCNVFIHECTYIDEMQKQAIAYGHSTTKMAALNAVKVNAKLLLLTHFSTRYVESSDQIESILNSKDKTNNNTINIHDNTSLNNSNNNINLKAQLMNNLNDPNKKDLIIKQTNDGHFIVLNNNNTIKSNNNNSNNNDNETKLDTNNDDDDDKLYLESLQNEAEEIISQYNSHCIVRCACDFMDIKLNNNELCGFDIQNKLAIVPSKIHHFKNDLLYLKSIT